MGIAVLIRHGRSTANVADVLAGRTPGVALSSDGIEQAQALAAALREVPFNSIAVSPLQRTIETADIALDGRSFELLDAIIENDYGLWMGRPLSELRDLPEWAPLHAKASTFVFPGGEAIADIAGRAVAAVRTRASQDGLHAFVTHADIIALIANAAVGAGLDEYHRFTVAPASVTVVRVATDGSLGLTALNVPASGVAELLRGHAPRDGATV